jgi:hypothetical protein
MLVEQSTKHYWDGNKSIAKFKEKCKLIVIIVYKYGGKDSLVQFRLGDKERNDK